MTNKQAVERFEQAYSAKIEKMFWIAGALDNSDLTELIEDMDDEAFKKCFPEIASSKYYEDYRKDGELLQALCEKNKFGLVAEILIPIADNFSYDKKGKPTRWSTGGSSRIDYVYAETLALLMKEIEKSAAIHFKSFIKDDKLESATV